MSSNKIESTVENWENGTLGESLEHAEQAAFTLDDIMDETELQMISIRLQKSLITDLKFIANDAGIGYQTLLKQVLSRWTKGEMKRIVRAKVAEQEREAKEVESSPVGEGIVAA